MTERAARPILMLKLSETHADARNDPGDALAMFRIWTLLTGGADIRDLTVATRILR